MYRSAALVVLSLTVFSASAFGAEDKTPAAAPTTASLEQATPWAAPLVRPRPRAAVDTARRPRMLPALYTSLAALQAYDGYSTTAALGRGAYEANPMTRGVAGNSAAFWAVKAGSTAASIVLAERMWKTNRAGAIVTMVAVNGIMASVAARNASVLKALR